MRIAPHTEFSGVFLPSSVWGRSSGTLRVAPAESPQFAPMEHNSDHAKNPGILTRLQYAREHTVLLHGCLIRAMHPSGDCMRASKPIDHPDRIAFSSERGRV